MGLDGAVMRLPLPSRVDLTVVPSATKVMVYSSPNLAVMV